MLKRDFILKMMLSNINLKVQRKSGDYFHIKIGSLVKEPQICIEAINTMLNINNLEVNFCKIDGEDGFIEESLIKLPSIQIIKRYDPNDIIKTPLPKSMNLSESFVNMFTNPSRKQQQAGQNSKISQRSVAGFKIQDESFYDLVYNFCLVIKIQDIQLTLPFDIQPIA